MRFWILVLVSAISHKVFSQEFLLLDGGRKDRVKYQVGDVIYFKVQGKDSLYHEQISAINDTAVFFGNMPVKYPDFRKISRYKTTFLNSTIPDLLFRAGVGFFFLDTFNRVVNSDRPVVTKAGLIMLGAVGVPGTVLLLTVPKWFKASEKRKIRYLDMRPVAD